MFKGNLGRLESLLGGFFVFSKLMATLMGLIESSGTWTSLIFIRRSLGDIFFLTEIFKRTFLNNSLNTSLLNNM